MVVGGKHSHLQAAVACVDKVDLAEVLHDHQIALQPSQLLEEDVTRACRDADRGYGPGILETERRLVNDLFVLTIRTHFKHDRPIFARANDVDFVARQRPLTASDIPGNR